MIREIRHVALHEKVYAEIRRSLMAGQFEPGQKLSSRKLAAALGTSDMPVRTALSRLIAEGGLIRRPNNTICVPRCSRQSFKEGMDMRVLLEQHATKLACENLTNGDFRSLDQYAMAIGEAGRAKDVSRYLDVNQHLKFVIYARCGSETLLALLQMLWLRIGPVLRSLSPSLDHISETNFHSEAIAALRRRDADAAGAAIARDIAAGRDLLLATARFDDDASEPTTSIAAGGDR